MSTGLFSVSTRFSRNILCGQRREVGYRPDGARPGEGWRDKVYDARGRHARHRHARRRQGARQLHDDHVDPDIPQDVNAEDVRPQSHDAQSVTRTNAQKPHGKTLGGIEECHS